MCRLGLRQKRLSARTRSSTLPARNGDGLHAFNQLADVIQRAIHTDDAQHLHTRVHLTHWLCLAAAILLSCSLGVAETGNPASIRVVIDDNYPPYIFRDDRGQLQGLLKDRWELWSRKTGITVDLRGMDWVLAQAEMAAGHADVIDTMFFTELRAQRYAFSAPYERIDVAIFFHKSISGIRGVDTLHGFTVGVKAGDACIDWLRQRGIQEFQEFPSYAALVDAAIDNQVKLFCIDKPPALYLLKKRGLDKAFGFSPPLYSGEFHWAVDRNNPALKMLVENGFAAITAEEQHQLAERWLPNSQSQAVVARYGKIIAYALLVALVITTGLVVWSRALRHQVRRKTEELTATLAALRSSQQHFKDLVTTTPVGVFETDANGACIYANQQWLDLAGLTLEQSLGAGWKLAVHPDDLERVLREWDRTIRGGHKFEIEYRFAHADSRVVWVIEQASPTFDAGRITGFIGSATNITERKISEAHVEFLAHHDVLTGLPNRALAKDRLERAIAYAERNRALAAVCFLDLDHFKTINDSLGHALGDSVLKAAAQRLRQCLRETDTISRQGGDEFLVILPELHDADEINGIALKMIEQLSRPFLIDDHELSISLSIGISVYPEDGRDIDTLLKKSDIAMYHAKAAGRSTHRFYSEQMNLDATEHLQIRAGLTRALERNELVLHYQPQIDLNTQAVVGAEALVRWQHPEMGLLPPARFIQIAEDSALIVPIGEWVLREACRQAVLWRDQGWPLVVAVNLSGVQFKRDNLEHTVVSALADSGLEPELLELELTESILIQNTESVLATVQRLNALGIKLSIDDFGTGYSSLAYLKRFDVDKLKIDRSFVKDLVDDPDDAAIVRAIIQMAHSLGLKTIAEGVESDALLQALRAYHCDEAQGYLFSKPLDAAAFAEYLQRTMARFNSDSRSVRIEFTDKHIPEHDK